MKTQILTLLLVTLFVSIIGCEKSTLETINEVEKSSTELTDPKYTIGDQNGYKAQCSSFAQDQFAGYTSSFRDPLTDSIDHSIINVRITDAPSALFDKDDQKIEFSYWQERVKGNIQHSPSKASFTIQSRYNGYYVAQGPDGKLTLSISKAYAKKFNYLSKDLILKIQSEVKQTYDQAFFGDLTEFFSQVIINLQNVGTSYQAFDLSLYPMEGGEAHQSVQSLMPPFYSHPHTYSTTHDSTTLNRIHPNADIKGSGLSDYEFLQITNDLCRTMYND